MKLSAKQKEVIRLMREGWECGVYPRTRWFDNNKSRLQQGGLGKGGKAITFSNATLMALSKNGLVKPDGGINPIIYYLTELGKTIDL